MREERRGERRETGEQRRGRRNEMSREETKNRGDSEAYGSGTRDGVRESERARPAREIAKERQRGRGDKYQSKME